MSSHSFWTTAELRAAGHSTRTIRDAIDAGMLERVIRGWYCTRDTDREAVRAMRLGGRLGCVSALGLHGGWVPPDQGVHVELASHASGRRLAIRGLPAGFVSHWHRPDDATGSSAPIASIELAVDRMLSCQAPDFAVAVLDSLAHRRIVSLNRLRSIVAAGPYRCRYLVDHVDPRSEDGTESVVRFRLRAAGIATSVQVKLRTRDRLDLEVDGWLVIEVDGRGTHAQEKAFTADRVRSARIMRDGRIVLQFAYATVMYDWPFVLEVVRAVIAQHAPIG